MISLLGLAQIPLGLTLYGSPVALFILYALAALSLLLIYFILSYLQGPRGGSDYNSYKYGSGSAAEERRQRSGLGGLAKAGIAGAGIATIFSRFRNRSKSRAHNPEVVGSRRHSGSYVEEEKYSRHERDADRGAGWKNWLLNIGAIAGGVAIAKRLMNRGNRDRDRDRDSDIEDYGPPPPGVAAPISPERLEEGRPLPTVQHPLNRRRSISSLSHSSYMSASGERRQGHGIRDAVAGLGAFGLARNIFKKRRERKENIRLETQRQRELEEERRARSNNQRLTGDGFSRPAPRRGSLSASTDYSTSTDDHPRRDSGMPPPIPVQHLDRDRHNNTMNPGNPTIGTVPTLGSIPMPPIPPDSQGVLHPDSSSEAYASPGGRQHRRHRAGRRAAADAPLVGSAAGLAAVEANSSQRDRRHSASGGEASVASPPISIKVKMYPEGRHVTLRRLPEEEAAAERSRRSKDRHGRRRKGSMNSLSGSEGGGGNRWRRKDALDRQKAEAMGAGSGNLPSISVNNPNQPLPVPMPPPAPVPESSIGHRPGTGSVGSPGTHDGTPTEASATYRDNRKRRRAERSQAQLARDGRQGTSIDFT